MVTVIWGDKFHRNGKEAFDSQKEETNYYFEINKNRFSKKYEKLITCSINWQD